MKKSAIFIVSCVIAIFVGSIYGRACGWCPDDQGPYNIKMFRLSNIKLEDLDAQLENCRLWQKNISQDIPIDDIKEVIYSSNFACSTKWLRKKYVNRSNPNKFAKWLLEEGASAWQLLCYAKRSEAICKRLADPWYFPYEEDEEHQLMGALISELTGMMSDDKKCAPWLKERVYLQMSRCLFHLRDYQTLILWKNEISYMEENFLIRQIEGYVAGAYYHSGDVEKAKEMYGEIGDYNSLIYCLKYDSTKGFSRKDKLEYIYTYAPDCNALVKLFELYVNGEYEIYTYEGKRYEQDAPQNDLSDFVNKVIKEKKCKDMASWYYAAAFLALDSGNYSRVMKYISLARSCGPSEYVEESLRVLEIFANAKFLPLVKDYEDKLFSGIRYLNSWLKREIETGEIYKCEYYWYVKVHSYPYKMIRKIVEGVVCPRYLKAGTSGRLLALAYYTNHIVPSEDLPWQSYSFYYLDTMPIDDVVAFVESRYPGANLPLYKFLRSEVPLQKDYLYDIVGTRYLRLLDYPKAVKYLSKVSPQYEKQLNCWSYLNEYCPVVRDGNGSEHLANKLYFAQQMCKFEKEATSTDIFVSLRAKVMYLKALRLSFTDSWAYTRYSDSSGSDSETFRWAGFYGEYGEYDAWYSENIPEHSKKVPEYVKERIAELDNEIYLLRKENKDVKYLLSSCHYWRWPDLYEKQGLKTREEREEYYRAHCDSSQDWK